MLKRLVKEVRNQPEHIRHIFMWLCVVIVFSGVGFVWLRTTQTRLLAMIEAGNQAKENIDQGFAVIQQGPLNDLAEVEQDKRPAIGAQTSLWSSLRASLGELFSANRINLEPSSEGSSPPREMRDNFIPLPLSSDR